MNSVPFLNSSLDRYNGKKNPGIILMNITRINIAMEILYRLIWLKNDIANEVLTMGAKIRLSNKMVELIARNRNSSN